MRAVYRSHLGYRRFKSPARKVEVKRFCRRFMRSIIVSPKPLQPRGALYALIIVSNKEL